MSNNNPVILSIDTSCDDTSVAVLKGRIVLSSIISSQVELHKKWGGVVPDIARRAHKENINLVYQEALKRAKIQEKDIEYVAVTQGPGLSIALEVGLEFAKQLSLRLNIPFVPINHMEGHLLANFCLNLKAKGQIDIGEDDRYFPALALLISGNHTEIILVKDFGQYKILGETLDDAAGEAFDKVARMLNLGYPGGPIITLLADRSDKSWHDTKEGFKRRKGKKPIDEIAGKFGLPIPMLKSGDLNFSFSGLKTSCLYTIDDIKKEYNSDKEWTPEFSREFINSVSSILRAKLQKAMDIHPEIKAVFIGGGVSNNKYIVREVGNLVRKLGKRFFVPEIRFRSDNGAMIGIAAYYNITKMHNYVTGSKVESYDRKPMLKLGDKLID